MILRELQIAGFRNLQDVKLNFHGGTTIIRGPNGQGKTNLLEAAAMLAFGRSFRTRDERELLPWGSEAGACALVRGTIERHPIPVRCSVGVMSRRKKVTVDGVPLARLGDLLGLLRAVLFLPADMELVHGAPTMRRRLLDLFLLQHDRDYLDELQRYDSALRHRNSLLRKLAGPPSPSDHLLLESYEQILAQHGPSITAKRKSLLGLLSPAIESNYRRLSGVGTETITVEFQDGWGRDHSDGSHDAVIQAYRQCRDQDRMRGHAGMGCHRDDFKYSMDGRRASQFASQGQRRTAVIATKLAEVTCLQEITGTTPLLLMDDLMSELDQSRQRALIESLPSGIQTLITTTDSTEIPVESAQVFSCKNGAFEEGIDRARNL